MIDERTETVAGRHVAVVRLASSFLLGLLSEGARGRIHRTVKGLPRDSVLLSAEKSHDHPNEVELRYVLPEGSAAPSGDFEILFQDEGPP